jgi:hypothetical protein
MKRTVLMCLLLTSNLVFNTVIASVTVVVNKEQYEFTHEPRLVEVLAPIADQGKWYWLGSALYRADDIQLEKTRESLLGNILTLSKRYRTEQPKTARSLEQLRATISSWTIARRLPVKIDYDLARIVASANPRLPHGKYILKLTPRMDTVQLFGAINETVNLPHRAHADVSEYMTGQQLTNLADKDRVIILQADGRKIIAPVAYWNKTHQEVMPGSQLFVPFKQTLFQSEFDTINQQIMTLALNRVQ